MTAAATIRPAVTDDLDGIVKLADAKRGQYASYQPVFWRPAADAIVRHRLHLATLIDDDKVITVVAITDHIVVGFAIGIVVPAPPVYDPGGPTCFVDDFAVDAPERWGTIGVDLLWEVLGSRRSTPTETGPASCSRFRLRTRTRTSVPRVDVLGIASQQHGDLIDNHLMDQVSQVAAVSCRDLGRPVRARTARAP